MYHLEGILENFDGKKITVSSDFGDIEYLTQKSPKIEIKLSDGRNITLQQRKAIYALFRDISDHTGYMPEEIKELMKCDFISTKGVEWFSLSDVDMTTANDFIEHLIEFCIYWEVPVNTNLLEITPDISRYVYYCTLHKTCCITGKKAELHHIDSVGMGRNRKEIIHIGMRVLPLCRQMHNEIHQIGTKTFLDKYKIYPVEVDIKIAKKYNLKE